MFMIYILKVILPKYIIFQAKTWFIGKIQFFA